MSTAIAYIAWLLLLMQHSQQAHGQIMDAPNGHHWRLPFVQSPSVIMPGKETPRSWLEYFGKHLGIAPFGLHSLYSHYGGLPSPSSSSATKLTWTSNPALPSGVQLGYGFYEVRYYELRKAELRLPQHRRSSSSPLDPFKEVELILTHEWVNSSGRIHLSAEAKKVLAKQSNSIAQLQVKGQHDFQKLSSKVAALEASSKWTSKLYQRLLVTRQKQLQAWVTRSWKILAETVSKLREKTTSRVASKNFAIHNFVQEAKDALLKASRMAQSNTFTNDTWKVVSKTMDGMLTFLDHGKELFDTSLNLAERDVLRAGYDVFDTLQVAHPHRYDINDTSPMKMTHHDINATQDYLFAKESTVKKEKLESVTAQKEFMKALRNSERETYLFVLDKIAENDIGVKIGYLNMMKKAKEELDRLGTVSAVADGAGVLLASKWHVAPIAKWWQELSDNVLDEFLEHLGMAVQATVHTDTLVQKAEQCSGFPLDSHCMPDLEDASNQLRLIGDEMLRAALTVSMASTASKIQVVIPLLASREDIALPSQLEALNFQFKGADAYAATLQQHASTLVLPGGHGMGYAPVSDPQSNCKWLAEVRIVMDPINVPQTWFSKARAAVLDNEGQKGVHDCDVRLNLGAGEVQTFDVSSHHADHLYHVASFAVPLPLAALPLHIPDSINKMAPKKLFFITAVAQLVFLCILALAVEIFKKREYRAITKANGKIPNWTLCEFLGKTQVDGLRQDIKNRYCFIGLATILIIVHVCLLVVFPWRDMRDMRCLEGYPWQKHIRYTWFQFFSRSVELWFYYHMGGPGLGCGWVVFKMLLGLLGGLDYYTDIIFILLTYLCSGLVQLFGFELWVFTILIFALGVLGMQVLAPSILALLYPNRRLALLMRLMHFEVLSDYYNPMEGSAASYTQLRQLEGEKAHLSRSRGFQKLKACLGFTLTLARVFVQDLPSIGTQVSFKTELPTIHDTVIKGIMIVSIATAFLTFVSSTYDLWAAWPDEMSDEEYTLTSFSILYPFHWLRARYLLCVWPSEMNSEEMRDLIADIEPYCDSTNAKEMLRDRTQEERQGVGWRASTKGMYFTSTCKQTILLLVVGIALAAIVAGPARMIFS